MKRINEYNLLFLGFSMLLILAVLGIDFVDNSLTGLLKPDLPYSTVSVGYDHGVIVKGPGKVIHLQAQDIGSLMIKEGSIELRTCGISIRVPFTCNICSLVNFR